MKSKFLFVMSVAGAMLLASCNQPAPSPATTTQETTSMPAGTSVETPEVVSVVCTVENDQLEVGKTLTLDPVVTVKGGANKKCEFKSSNDKIATVDIFGVVTGVGEGEVKITITSVADSTKKAEVTLHIIPAKVVAIKDFVSGQEYTVTGKVVATNTRSFLIHDGTGAIMVYLNDKPKQEIGQVVEVSGKVAATDKSAGLVQFDSNATIKGSDKIIENIPEAVELQPATVEAWVTAYGNAENKAGQYYKQDEMKLYKWTTIATKEGGYDVIKVPGSDVVIEPTYADSKVFKLEEGKKYDVEGYFAGYRVSGSSGSAYAQIVLTKVTEKQAQPGEVFVTADKKSILIDEVANLTATIEQGGDTVVQWSLKEANMGRVVELTVDPANGNKVAVKGLAVGEAIVVATNGNFSFETKITVSAITEVAISNITEAGKAYSATGVVAALTSKGFVLSDGAASIYVYLNETPTVVVGDMVKVEGGVATYNKVFQFSATDKVKPVTVTKVEGNIPNLPVAIDLTPEIVAGWKDGKSFATTDVKLYKWTAKATKPDKFVMTNLEGCEIDIEPSNVPSNIKIEAGKTYDLEAYFGGYNGSYNYAAMYITKAEEVGGGEQTSEQGSQPAESTEQGQSTEQGSVEVKNHGTVSEPITVAEAKSIVADLADPASGGVYDDEMLYVTGVVVEVTYAWKTGKSMSFTLKDAGAADADALDAKYIYLASDMTEAPAAGDTVLLRGYACKYNSKGTIIPQISAPNGAGEDTRATVLSFQKAGGQQTSEEGSQPVDSSEIVPVESSEQGSVEVKNHGTVSEPITVAEAKSIVADLADPASGGVYDDEMLYVTGVVAKVTYEWKGAGKNMSFTIKDADAADADALDAKYIYLASDMTEAPAAGDTVLLRGYACKYNSKGTIIPQISAPNGAGEDTRATVLSIQKAGGQQTSSGEQTSTPVESTEPVGSVPEGSSEVGTATSVLTRESTGVTGTVYSDWTYIDSVNGISYAGQSAGGSDSIQLRSTNSNSGIVITGNANGKKVAKVAVTWNDASASGRTVSVYGKTTAYSDPTDLYGADKGTALGEIINGTSVELTISGEYEFIGLRSKSGALYLNSITITFAE